MSLTVITKTEGVCGGAACIGNRRIPVWVIAEYRILGASPAAICGIFDPPLTLQEFKMALAYWKANADEIGLGDFA